MEQMKRAVHGLANKSHAKCANRADPAHERYRRERSDYTEQIRRAKKEHWYSWLKSISASSIWTANRFISGPATDGGRARIPALRVMDELGMEREVRDNKGKSAALFSTFFLPAPAQNTRDSNSSYPPPKAPFKNITNAQISRAIGKIAQYKAPGPSGVSNAVLTHCKELITPHLGPIFRATFSLKIYPAQWKTSKTIVLRKLGKPSYATAKAYRPIALLDTIAKILSSCVAEHLSYMAEAHAMLLQNHFGGRPGRTATDSLHLVTKFIKDAWRRKKVVSALFLDVAGAYPAVDIPKLLHNMQKWGVPIEYTNWLKEKYRGRHTTINFDDFESAIIKIVSGADQGCPMSQLIFQFYNADLIEPDILHPEELKVGFVDDVALLAEGATFEAANQAITSMMTRPSGALNWADLHNSTFDITKTGLVGFTRQRTSSLGVPAKTMPLQQLPITIRGREIMPKTSHPFLGLVVDEELRFREHSAKVLAKGTAWVQQIGRLSKIAQGMTGQYARQLYLNVAVPQMLYAVDIFSTPIQGVGRDKKQAGARLVWQANWLKFRGRLHCRSWEG